MENAEVAKETKPRFRELIKDIKYPLLIIFVVFLIQSFAISQFRQLPGPLYGGDAYLHHAETLFIYEGNSPLENFQVSGEVAYYPWLNQLVIALIGKLVGSTFQAYVFFPALLTILIGISSYFLGKELFHGNRFPLAFCFLFLTMSFTLSDTMRVFGDFLLSSLFLLFLARSLKSDRILDRILAGIFLGLAGLTHVVAMPALGLFTALLFIYTTLLSRINLSLKGARLSVTVTEKKGSVTKSVMTYLPILVIGSLISMLFFWPIMDAYKVVAKNPVNIYTDPDFTKYGVDVLISTLSATFLNFSGIGNAILSMLTLVGIYFAVSRRDELGPRLMLMLLAASFIGGFHYFITIPIIGTYLIPLYFFSFLIKIAVSLLCIFALASLYEKLGAGDSKKIFMLIAFAFLALNFFIKINSAYSDQWTQNGMSEPSPVFSEIKEWVSENTMPDDVFLSHEELSFAISSLTNRKIVTCRRTHFSPYIDIDERMADSSVMLYGNNSEKTSELLEKYNVSYLFWDANWLVFSQREPPIFLSKYENYISQNGVKYQKGDYYLDPAWEEWYPKYEVVAPLPYREDPLKPWSDELDSRLTLLKTFYIEGKEYAKIYRID